LKQKIEFCFFLVFMSRKAPQTRSTHTGLKDLSNKLSKIQLNTKTYVQMIRSLNFHIRFMFSPIRKFSAKSFTVDKLIDTIKAGQYKRIVVLAGAGISTPSGIPDFR